MLDRKESKRNGGKTVRYRIVGLNKSRAPGRVVIDLRYLEFLPVRTIDAGQAIEAELTAEQFARVRAAGLSVKAI